MSSVVLLNMLFYKEYRPQHSCGTNLLSELTRLFTVSSNLNPKVYLQVVIHTGFVRYLWFLKLKYTPFTNLLQKMMRKWHA